MFDMPNHYDQPCLVIFCKRPTLFQGKQRLAKTIGAEQALLFAELFLNCALEDAVAWPGFVVLSPSSHQDFEWASNLLNREHSIIAQPEGNLGHRLQIIDQQLRAKGYDKIYFIGSDAPALKSQHYSETRKALNEKDVVLCPVSDGGVAIMGSRVPWPDLEPMPWSTHRLGKALELACVQQNLSIRNITPSYDIDVEADLRKLLQDLSGDVCPARQALYAQLCAFFKQDEVKYGRNAKNLQ